MGGREGERQKREKGKTRVRKPRLFPITNGAIRELLDGDYF